MVALQVTALADDNDVAFRVIGDVDIASVPELRRAMASTLVETTGPLVVDLFDVTFIDASGLGALVWFANQAGEQRRPLSVRDASAFTLRLLQLTGLDRRFGLISTPPGAAPRRTARMNFSMPVG